MELTEADFNEKTFNEKFTYAKLLASWRGHCKKMEPDRDRIGEFVSKLELQVQILNVDCTVDTATSPSLNPHEIILGVLGRSAISDPLQPSHEHCQGA